MAKTIVEIEKLLNADEPDYFFISSELDDKDYPALEKIISGSNTDIIPAAICVIGRMSSKKSLNILAKVAGSADPDIREAAAIALKYRKKSPTVIKLLKKLAVDNDIGVRKATLETIAFTRISELKDTVQNFSLAESNYMMVKLAQRVMLSIDKPVTQ